MCLSEFNLIKIRSTHLHERESTLCVAGALIGRLADPTFISLTTIEVGKKIKDRKREF